MMSRRFCILHNPGDYMRILLLIIVAMSAGILLINPIVTSAHGDDPHSGHIDAQMKKLHAMMPVFSTASAELESALEKGDAAATKNQASRILAAVTDLKKSKPHKNIKQRKKFVVLATNLEDSLTATVDLAQKGDFVGAKAAFKKVEEICVACHAKFRN
jgi:soluble cytochrome b562